MSGPSKRRPSKRVPETAQVSLALGTPPAPPVDAPPAPRVALPADRFVSPDPTRLFLGAERLDRYLLGHDHGWVVRLREQIYRSDLSTLRADYSAEGRKPFHPALMLGLIVYGILLGQTTLRQLEALAVRDVAAWWLCGGAQPDHATIGRFIDRHAEVLTEPYFTALTTQLVRQLRLRNSDAAFDGTVVEAAASRFHTLRAEAAREQAAEARRDAKAAPQDPQAQAAAQHAEQVAARVETRAAARQRKDGKGHTVRIAPSDPEAVIQPRKDDAVRPAYKPSVFAHASRLIIAQHTDPSSEVAAVAPMLTQYHKVFGAMPERVMADAGYFGLEVLALMVQAEIDALIPSGQALSEESFEKKPATARFHKRLFVFQPEADEYRCPEGRPLQPTHREHDGAGRTFRIYVGTECTGCPSRPQCTEAKDAGRSIRRYDGEENKEAMTEVMRQPAARQAYRQRAAIVEPVFAALRERQALRRFRRRGLRGVSVEFALHCIAYNLRRADNLAHGRGAGGAGLLAVLRMRVQGGGWVVLSVVVVLAPGH